MEGDFFINNEKLEKNSKSRNLMSFQTQDSFCFEYLSTKELIQFALSRDYSGKELIKNAEEYIWRFDLWECRNVIFKSLSGGQKSRLNLVVALIYDNPIILSDEPTSTCDSHTALLIIKELKKQTLRGKNVLISIHQPSVEILSYIDEIFLMSEGVFCYTGAVDDAEKYFEKLGFVNEKVNISEFLLDLTAKKEDENEENLKDQLEKSKYIHEKWSEERIKFSVPKNVAPVGFLKTTEIPVMKIVQTLRINFYRNVINSPWEFIICNIFFALLLLVEHFVWLPSFL